MEFIAKDVLSIEEAERVSRFIIDTFDDSRFTAGELLQIKELPLKSIKENNVFFWYVENENKEMIGVAGLHENEMLSGGYDGDYMAIRKDFRGKGLSDFFFNKMFSTAISMNGRYIMLITGDSKEYAAAQRVIARNKFNRLYKIRHYYFQNEDAVVFIRYL